LVTKAVGGNTTRFVHDRNLALPQMLTDGSTTYMYGAGMESGYGPLMQETGGGTKSWLGDDVLGSVRFTTNNSGASIGSATYDVFGAQRVTSGQQNRYRFAGQEDH